MQAPATVRMYRNRIVTPDGITFDFNESDLNVPLLSEPHVNNSKNRVPRPPTPSQINMIPILSKNYNELMFIPNKQTNENFKNRTLRSYNLSLDVVRDRIFKQFIENSINILEPAVRPMARENFDIYDKKYRELLQRDISRTSVPPSAYAIPVGGGTLKRKRS